jgi:hypothetical protein
VVVRPLVSEVDQGQVGVWPSSTVLARKGREGGPLREEAGHVGQRQPPLGGGGQHERQQHLQAPEARRGQEDAARPLPLLLAEGGGRCHDVDVTRVQVLPQRGRVWGRRSGGLHFAKPWCRERGLVEQVVQAVSTVLHAAAGHRGPERADRRLGRGRIGCSQASSPRPVPKRPPCPPPPGRSPHEPDRQTPSASSRAAGRPAGAILAVERVPGGGRHGGRSRQRGRSVHMPVNSSPDGAGGLEEGLEARAPAARRHLRMFHPAPPRAEVDEAPPP